MKNSYLNDFSDRMEHVGLYAILLENLASKQSFEKYGLDTFSKQVNLIFAILLFVMEKTLLEETCTKDDLLQFIHETHWQLTKVQLTKEEESTLTDLIVDDVFMNNGLTRSMEGFDFEEETYTSTTIRYFDTKRVEIDGHDRVSYSLTDQGYNLILSTKEIESNMKLDVQELIFNLHMERMDYGKAVDDVKNIYSLIRTQLLKIDMAEAEMRRNVIQYGFDRYQKLIDENNDTKEEMFKRLVAHKDKVQIQIKEFEQRNQTQLQEDMQVKIDQLSKIIYYLDLSIDEHLSIFNAHTNLKRLYTKELEKMSQLELIHCFSLKNELYEPVLKDANTLERLHYFLSPLFQKDLPKAYNINKAVTYDMKRSDDQNEANLREEIDLKQLLELEQKRIEQAKKRLSYYKFALITLLNKIEDGITFSEMEFTEEELETLVPCVSIFKEMMIQLLIKETIDLKNYKAMTNEFAQTSEIDFHLNQMLVEIVEELPYLSFDTLSIEPLEENEVVILKHVYDDFDDTYKDIRFTDLRFHKKKETL